MQISRGKIEGAQKVVIYGPEGIGKSSFAAKFPNPLFIDTEGSTKKLDVARTPKPSSWTMITEQVLHVKRNPYMCDTLIIDTADWAEMLCKAEVCSKSDKKSLADFGYGNGFIYLAEDFGKLLNLLEDLIELGINVVITAHATMRKFEQPDEMGSYDRWEMKLEKKVFPLVKEWADMVLFANFKTYVVNVDNQGAAKGKNKAQGGKRVMYTSHHPCWDAKNRDGLPPELNFDYAEIAHCIHKRVTPEQAPKVVEKTTVINPEVPKEVSQAKTIAVPPKSEPKQEPPKVTPPSVVVPKPLADLMATNNVTAEEVQKVVAYKGYYPANTPIANYDQNFINGVLVGAWPQVFKMIQELRELPLPF